jgi:hypothetical protein
MSILKPLLAAALCLAAMPGTAALTETETRWLRAGLPVLGYAKAQLLPIDIVVQPDPRPGDPPLAMGFVDGRCTLVLSMRGNPAAEAALADVQPALVPVVIEAMIAHEVGHCWRHVQGTWHGLPPGLVLDSDASRLAAWHEMRATRREEGFADLVGLAWTLSRHPEEYAAVHAWFERARDDQPVAGSHHDTRAWLRLAKERSAFAAADTPFEQARALWQRGLLDIDYSPAGR